MIVDNPARIGGPTMIEMINHFGFIERHPPLQTRILAHPIRPVADQPSASNVCGVRKWAESFDMWKLGLKSNSPWIDVAALIRDRSSINTGTRA